MSIFLCGNTGIVNRGCEAIIRSTVGLLPQKRGSIYLVSDYYKADLLLSKELGINFISYQEANAIQKVLSRLERTVSKKSLKSEKIFQAHLFHDLKKDDVCLNIGGDVYCYGRPVRSIAMNKYATDRGAKTILWCCSIELGAITKEIIEDLNRYDYIFVRESISEKNLIDSGIERKKIIRVCDPAFFLNQKITRLPSVFNNGDTIGINLSELVIKTENDTVYKAVIGFIKYIIDNTDYNICLIPHVYDIEKNLCDWPILSRIKQDINSERVEIVDKELNCAELKYIISHCRFIFAARTHASIAAYSSIVPTVVLGYSVKSKGIAKDLFGDYKKFVIHYSDIRDKHVLIDAFQFLEKNEETIKRRLQITIPKYKQLLIQAIHDHVGSSSLTECICDKNLCTGCLACKKICPKNAIVTIKDQDGFLYPFIESSMCIKCNRCRDVCPVLNREKDRLTPPICYGAINRNSVIRSRSSSGGIFYLLAKYIIERNGVVFGASFDENNDVRHIGVSETKDIEVLQRSKYVQSDLNDTFSQIKKILDEGTLVLFTGTPCQVEGLYNYLQKEYNNLYTQDIICHGVPSHLQWNEYKKYISNKYRSEIIKVVFRNKEKGWSHDSSFDIKLASGRKISNKLSEDPFFQGLINHLLVRQSCYECAFRKITRRSDITLADFWGIEKLDTDLFDDKGTSLVLVHSQKGAALFDAVKENLIYKNYAFDDAIQENPSYLFLSDPSPFAGAFKKMWKKKGFIEALNYYNNLHKHRIRYICARVMNWSWKNEK